MVGLKSHLSRVVTCSYLEFSPTIEKQVGQEDGSMGITAEHALISL